MKNRFIITIILFSFLALGCKNNQSINFDLSIIDDFIDYKKVVEKYKTQIKVGQKMDDCKESSNEIMIVGKEFQFIYNDLFYYDEKYHFFLLLCSNPSIKLKGIKIIGKSLDEILALIKTTSDVEIQKGETFIRYKISKSKPSTFYLHLNLKKNKVISYSLGFEL